MSSERLAAWRRKAALASPTFSAIAAAICRPEGHHTDPNTVGKLVIRALRHVTQADGSQLVASLEVSNLEALSFEVLP